MTKKQKKKNPSRSYNTLFTGRRVDWSALPEGVSVNIVPLNKKGQALVRPPAAQGDGTQSLFFADGTEYEVRVTNDSGRRLAFLIQIDGRPVTFAPLMMRKNKATRIIKGFSLRREAVPQPDGSDPHQPRAYTRTELESFVARRTDAHGPTNPDIGKVLVAFMEVRFVNGKDGPHDNTIRQAKPLRGSARPNVLTTSGGARSVHVGYHAGYGRRPIPKLPGPVTLIGWTIYDSTS